LADRKDSTTQHRHLEAKNRLVIQDEVEAYIKENASFNFPKMLLLTHFRLLVGQFDNIQLFSTELGESSHQASTFSYRRLNRIDAFTQILIGIVRQYNF
jgi:hypothetical protein